MLKRKVLSLCGVMLGISSAGAQNLTVNFDATIQEPTCNVYIAASPNGSGAGSSAEIKFNAVQLDKILSKDASARQVFSLKMDSCTAGLTRLVTTIKTPTTLMSSQAIGNSLSGTGSAQNIGVTIARDNAPDTLFTLNSTTDSQRLVWSSAEISAQTVALRATLVADGGPTLGSYSGTATFETTYE
ncbi:fimbrial protein [Salmonella enterica]|nr:fimbrial protein [Salmonella enterica]EFQ6618141.1 fimbrial protein [Salmonella enterica]